MTQAIQTKYHGPSNVRGSRVIATCAAKRIVLDWDDALNADRNHKAAAEEMCRRMKWSGKLARGTLKDGTVVWVFYNDLHPVDQITADFDTLTYSRGIGAGVVHQRVVED